MVKARMQLGSWRKPSPVMVRAASCRLWPQPFKKVSVFSLSNFDFQAQEAPMEVKNELHPRKLMHNYDKEQDSSSIV
jgi:hypothetical protein